jgi:hypothetical protein
MFEVFSHISCIQIFVNVLKRLDKKQIWKWSCYYAFLLCRIKELNILKWVGVNCSKFDCSTIICSTLLAGNQLLDTKFINCLNPVNACLTGFEQMTKILSIARIQFKIAVDHYFLLINLQKLLEFNLLDTFCS